MAQIFLSHSSEDMGAAEELHDRLKRWGYDSIFLDFRPDNGIPAGRIWEEMLYRNLRTCGAVIILCSRASMESRWCFAEIALAGAFGLNVFPVVIDDCTLDEVLKKWQVVDVTKDGEGAYLKLREGLRSERFLTDDLADNQAGGQGVPARPPYPGLAYFEREDARVFFGREEEAREVIGLLDQGRRAGQKKLVVIAAPSGHGKSSLARAGVLPRLPWDRWRIVNPFRPGQSPFARLAEALAFTRIDGYKSPDAGMLLESFRGGIERAATQLVEVARQMIAAGPSAEMAVLLTIDPLEETFQTGGSPGLLAECDAFHATIRRAIDAPDSPLVVLATIRSDFQDALQGHPAWRDCRKTTYDLPVLSRDRLDRIIRQPAIRAGLSFEEGLIDRLVRDAGDADALPLLAYALGELYDKRESDYKITHNVYENRVNGIGGSIVHAVHKALGSNRSDRELSALRRTFIHHLAWPGDNDRYLRRSALWDEIPAEAQPILEELIDARLLTSGKKIGKERRTLEVTHEILFVAWGELAGWLKEGRELLLWRQGIQQARTSWENAPKRQKSGHLLSGAKAAEARRWLADFADELPPSELSFLRASVDAAKRRSRNLKLTSGLFTLLVAVACWIASMARSEVIQHEATRSIARAEAGRYRVTQLAKTRLLRDAASDRERQGDIGSGAVLLGHALVGASGGAGPEEANLENALRVAITQAKSRLLPLLGIYEVGGQHRGAAISPDGKLAIVGSDRGLAWPIDMTGDGAIGEPYRTGEHDVLDSISAVAFDPTRGRLRYAIATDGGTIHILDRSSGTSRKLRHPGRPLSVAFSPDGKNLVVAGRRNKSVDPNSVALASYDLENGDRRHVYPTDHDLYVAGYSPDGRWLIAGGGIPPDPSLMAWDLRSPGTPSVALPQVARVFTLAFRPEPNPEMVTGDVNGSIRFWRTVAAEGGRGAAWVEDGKALRHDKPIRFASFTEDGRLLLVGGEDGTAQAWDVAARVPIGQRLVHRGEVRAGAISGRSGRLITADFSGDIRIWDLRPGAYTGRIFSHPSPVVDASFDAKGERVVTGCPGEVGAAGAGRVWNVETGAVTLLPLGADVMVARFRPGAADEVVTCGNDGRVAFWDAARGSRIGGTLSHNKEVVYSAAFDEAGKRFAFAGFGKFVRICDAGPAPGSFLARPSPLEHPVSSFTWNLRFASRGRLLADGGPGVRVWDSPGVAVSRDLRPIRKGAANEGKFEVKIGAIDGEGCGVLTLDSDGGANVWDIDSDDPWRSALGDKPHGRGQLCAAWHGGRDIIASGGPDGFVRFWKRDGTRWSSADLRHPAAVEVIAFSPDGRWLATGCRDGGMRLWSVDDGVWTGAGWHHTGPVTRVEFSADGLNLLSAGRDGLVRVERVPKSTTEQAEKILAGLIGDAGILVSVEDVGASSTAAAPQSLTARSFQEAREAARPKPAP